MMAGIKWSKMYEIGLNNKSGKSVNRMLIVQERMIAAKVEATHRSKVDIGIGCPLSHLTSLSESVGGAKLSTTSDGMQFVADYLYVRMQQGICEVKIGHRQMQRKGHVIACCIFEFITFVTNQYVYSENTEVNDLIQMFLSPMQRLRNTQDLATIKKQADALVSFPYSAQLLIYRLNAALRGEMDGCVIELGHTLSKRVDP
jgi:hypothetical protein